MRTRRVPEPGFTLIEMIVIMVIVMILALMGMPGYFKMTENERASTAVGMVESMANAQKMHILRGNAPVEAVLSTTHLLVTSEMIPDGDWDSLPFLYYTCNPTTGDGGGCCAATFYACADRREGAYTTWGYSVDDEGVTAAIGGAPEPYKM